DARSDLFALGVVLYEMATGAAPASGANVIGAWQRMSQKCWRPPRELVPSLPDRIDRAIGWALEPVPDHRPPNAAALWEVLFGEPFRAAPAAVTFVEPPPMGVSSPPSATTAVPKPARSLVGRMVEFAAVWDALDARGTVHTLVGTGGSGKTRLAVE